MTLSTAELAARELANVIGGWRVSLGLHPDAQFEREGSVVWISSALDLPFVNGIITDGPDVRPGVLEGAVGELRARGRPFVARLRVGADDAVAEELARLGMREERGETLPGLALHPIAFPGEAALPDGLVIRRATEEAGLADHYAIVVEAFGLPLEIASGLMPAAALAHEPLYVGYVDGEPAVTALTYTGQGTVGIYNVATREAWRRRGLGTAITRHAIVDAAATGATVAILQTSPAGRGVYESLGFREVMRYRILFDTVGLARAPDPGSASGTVRA
jgi:ribosomal protein S18 acetylase RimI-like enzyme